MADQKFNDDLLLSAKDQALARSAFPDLIHVLDHAELRAAFVRFDKPAMAAKRRSRNAGLISVLFAVLSLWAAATEPLYQAAPFARSVAILSAGFGIVSIIIALGGLMMGRSKKQWLHWRLVTERLRQFQFQTFVCRLPEVLESFRGEEHQQRYQAERTRWFSTLILRLDGKLTPEFSQIIGDPGNADIWLHPTPVLPDEATLESLPSEFFLAYRVLRIRHQLQFSLWKIRDETRFFVLGGLQQLENVMTRAAFFLIGLIFLIHLVIAISTSLNLHEFHSPWVNVVVVVAAVAVLALRALDEGFAPKRELERYHRYRLEVNDIQVRFDEAKSALQKVQVMIDMERIAFQEMCDFARSNNGARFIM